MTQKGAVLERVGWHDELSLEIAVEFIVLSGPPWNVIEDRLWRRRSYEHRAWAQHGQWWRKTRDGRRYFRDYQRKRVSRMKTVVVAVRGCLACGKPFELTAARQEKKRSRVCSTACRGALRKNIELVTIDGESLPLARWAKRYGVPLGTVWMRRRRGWDLRTALTSPVRGAS